MASAGTWVGRLIDVQRAFENGAPTASDAYVFRTVSEAVRERAKAWSQGGEPWPSLEGAYDALFAWIACAVNEWDPIGLLRMDAPLDEYDIEIRRIEAYLREHVDATVDALATAICDCFAQAFGADVFGCDMRMCEGVARGILENR